MLDARSICKAACLLGLALMFLGPGLIGLAPPARAETTFYVAVNGYVNVRAERSENDAILSTLDAGTAFDAPMDIRDGWQIVPVGDRWGWVRYDLLSIDPPFSMQATVAANGRVALREGPGAERGRVAWLDPGTKVIARARLTEGSHDWYRVKAGKRWGWVRGDLLEFEE